MKITVFKTEVTRCILTERERCAKLAEESRVPELAAKIRAARPPSFRIVKPQTVEKHPELLKRDDLIVSNLTAREVKAGARIANYDASRPPIG